MITLEDFRVLDVEAPETARRWVLWHEEAGAYTLEASGSDAKGRLAVLKLAQGKPHWSTAIGAELDFCKGQKPELKARLPQNAPAEGPALLQAALEALAGAYRPAPLALRDGRTREDLVRVMSAAAMLSRHAGTFYDFKVIVCHWRPDIPIRLALRHETHAPDGLVLDDIGLWFGAYAPLGEGLVLRSIGARGGQQGYACLEVTPPQPPYSAHQIVEATAVLADFYARAAADLGLTNEDVATRLAAMGCAAPA